MVGYYIPAQLWVKNCELSMRKLALGYDYKIDNTPVVGIKIYATKTDDGETYYTLLDPRGFTCIISAANFGIYVRLDDPSMVIVDATIISPCVWVDAYVIFYPVAVASERISNDWFGA